MQLAVHHSIVQSISDCSKMEFMAQKILTSSAKNKYLECLIYLTKVVIKKHSL